jgi:hypothetical protein
MKHYCEKNDHTKNTICTRYSDVIIDHSGPQSVSHHPASSYSRLSSKAAKASAGEFLLMSS